MNNRKIRYLNARALSLLEGGPTAFADRIGKAGPQITALVGKNPTRNIGDKIALQIEKAFGKPEGWIDNPHPELWLQAQLDTEDADLTLHVAEEKPTYLAARTIPLIRWDAISQWPYLPSDKKKALTVREVFTSLPGKNLFALSVDNDSMASPSLPSAPQGAILIVDPDIDIGPLGLAIVAANGIDRPVFKQIMRDLGQTYLRSLNAAYPQVAVRGELTVYGSVIQIVQDFMPTRGDI